MANDDGSPVYFGSCSKVNDAKRYALLVSFVLVSPPCKKPAVPRRKRSLPRTKTRLIQYIFFFYIYTYPEKNHVSASVWCFVQTIRRRNERFFFFFCSKVELLTFRGLNTYFLFFWKYLVCLTIVTVSYREHDNLIIDGRGFQSTGLPLESVLWADFCVLSRVLSFFFSIAKSRYNYVKSLTLRFSVSRGE